MNYSSHAFLTTEIAFVFYSFSVIRQLHCICTLKSWPLASLLWFICVNCLVRCLFCPEQAYWHRFLTNTICYMPPILPFHPGHTPTPILTPRLHDACSPPGKCRHTHLPLGISAASTQSFAPQFPSFRSLVSAMFLCLSFNKCELGSLV